jgi:uncharacterized membrane protein
MPNFHLILVHFPIALLTVYGILEIIPLRRFREWMPAFYIKGSLAIIGTITAYAALGSGGLIEDQFRSARNIVEAHSNMATLATGIFTLIAIVYLIAWLGRVRNYFPQLANRAENLLRSPILPMAALLGLIAITLTGALGGAIAFGPSADPWTPYVLKLFRIQSY